MNKIKNVTIEKLWGIKTISTDFYENVNIFIGSNGSSKTTFLQLIEAALLLDINILSEITFEKMIIIFYGDEENTIIVEKKVLGDNPLLIYSFSDATAFELPCSEYILQRSYRMHIKHRESYELLKNKLDDLVNISWLSVNRDNTNFQDFDRRDAIDRIKNMIDLKLVELTKGLMFYQLQLESETNKLANKFKEDTLSLMLYNADIDYYNAENITQFQSVKPDQMKSDLFKAFKTLGVEKTKTESILKHTEKLTEVIQKIQSNNQLQLNDIFPLALVKRTLDIISLSKKQEIENEKIFSFINEFWKSLKLFMPAKEFFFNKESNGELEIRLNNTVVNKISTIKLSSLSSGEKQLFILLSEALLQKTANHLFIADEPELSLHIDWQRKILGELLKLNPNAQIIVATHSPEIASAFPTNIINMKNIIRYE